MKKKPTSQSAFFNLRVLILIIFLTGSIVAALFAMTVDGRTRRGDTNPSGDGFGSVTARSAQVALPRFSGAVCHRPLLGLATSA
jgi:hypothetical protein